MHTSESLDQTLFMFARLVYQKSGIENYSSKRIRNFLEDVMHSMLDSFVENLFKAKCVNHYHTLSAWVVKAIKPSHTRTVLEHKKRERDSRVWSCIDHASSPGRSPRPSQSSLPWGARG